MEQHNLERAASIIVEEYGEKAEQKVVEKIQQLMEQNLYKTARNWVKIGYIVREKVKELKREKEEEMV